MYNQVSYLILHFYYDVILTLHCNTSLYDPPSDSDGLGPYTHAVIDNRRDDILININLINELNNEST